LSLLNYLKRPLCLSEPLRAAQNLDFEILRLRLRETIRIPLSSYYIGNATLEPGGENGYKDAEKQNTPSRGGRGLGEGEKLADSPKFLKISPPP
jgi:hypothetical protein